MKLPHPFCGGLIEVQEGAIILASIHAFFGAVIAIVYPIVRFGAGSGTGDYATTTNVLIGLIINCMINVVLLAAMNSYHVTACRYWLTVGIVGAGFFNYALYDIVTHVYGTGLQQPLPDAWRSLIIALAICQIYLWYVIYTFTGLISVATVSHVPVTTREGAGVLAITNESQPAAMLAITNQSQPAGVSAFPNQFQPAGVLAIANQSQPAGVLATTNQFQSAAVHADINGECTIENDFPPAYKEVERPCPSYLPSFPSAPVGST